MKVVLLKSKSRFDIEMYFILADLSINLDLAQLCYTNKLLHFLLIS